MKLLTFWTSFDLRFSQFPPACLHLEEVVNILCLQMAQYIILSWRAPSKVTRGERNFYTVLNGSMDTFYDDSSKLKGLNVFKYLKS